MSEEQFKSFLDKAKADTSLQEADKLNFLEKVKVETSLQEKLKAEGADPVAIAKGAGFAIKQQDLHRQASELSDEELEGVSGGCGGGYWGNHVSWQSNNSAI